MAAEVTQIRSSSLTVSELFSKPQTYRVPDYQRDYSWEDEQIDAFWEDISLQYMTLGQPNEYFIGTIVVSKDNKQGEKTVVDGQQRLTTISMLMAAIRNLWKKRGDDKRASGVSSDYLGKEDRRTSEIKPRLILNENNNPMFLNYILDDEREIVIKNLSPSNKLLIRAFQRIESHLELWLSESKDLVEDLLGIEEFIGSNLTIILIEAASDADAFIIFETLNDRGLELAVSDLVKNYLFSKGGNYLSQFKRQWNDIGTIINQDEVSKFIRYYWMSQGDFIRERDLYRSIKKGLPNTAAVRKFIDKLETTAKVYSSLNTPDGPYWRGYDNRAKEYLEALNIYKVTQYKIVAISAFQYLPSEVAVSVLRMLEVISFRLIVAGGSSTSLLEKIYSHTAGEINNKRVKNSKDIFELLNALYINDKDFLEAFKRFTTGRSHLQRYILSKINDFLEGDPSRKTDHAGRLSLEHIYPKSPTDVWDAEFANPDAVALVSNIGNLTILETGLNRLIGNEAFSYKKEKALCKSDLAVNKHICKSDEWTPKEIEARASALAQCAVQIWRLDF